MPATSEQIDRLFTIMNECSAHSEYEGNYELINIFLGGLEDEVRLSLVNKTNLGADTLFLNFACILGDENLVAILLKNGARVDIYDRNAEYPIHFAVKSANMKIVQMIVSSLELLPLDERTQISTCGRTALAEALEHIKDLKLQHQTVKILLEVGINPECGELSNKPLVIALGNYIESGEGDEVIGTLIKFKADANFGDKPSTNALLFAANNASEAGCEILMHHLGSISNETVGKMQAIALKWGYKDFAKWVGYEYGSNLQPSGAAGCDSAQPQALLTGEELDFTNQ